MKRRSWPAYISVFLFGASFFFVGFAVPNYVIGTVIIWLVLPYFDPEPHVKLKRHPVKF
jgi:hypothetical protein